MCWRGWLASGRGAPGCGLGCCAFCLDAARIMGTAARKLPPLFAGPWGPICPRGCGDLRSRAKRGGGAWRAPCSLWFFIYRLAGAGRVGLLVLVVLRPPGPACAAGEPVRGTSRAHRCAGPQGAREPSVLGEAARRRSKAEETKRAGCGASRWDGGPRLQGIPRRWRARPGVDEF